MSWASNFIQAQILGDSFRHALNVIEEKSPNANKQGKSECCRSGVCCWRRPGTVSKTDLDRLTVFFRMSAAEVFKKYLAVDVLKGIQTLIILRKHQSSLAGAMIPFDETYSLESPCMFLTEANACEVHESKPLQCSSYECWNLQKEFPIPKWTTEELLALGWDGVNPDDYRDDYYDE